MIFPLTGLALRPRFWSVMCDGTETENRNG